jgi:hypothetical protein
MLGAATATADDALLDVTPWQSQAYGLSLRPPLGCVHVPWPNSQVRARFVGGAGYSIDLSIRKRRDPDDEPLDGSAFIEALRQMATDQFQWELRRGDGPITLERVETICQQTVQVLDPSAVMLDRRAIQANGREAVAIYFRLSAAAGGLDRNQDRTTHWILGQAFLRLQDETFVVLRLDAPDGVFERVRPAFEAMVASLRVESPNTIAARRKQWLERGRIWQQMIDPKELLGSAAPEQFLRITRQGTDIGFMRVRQRAAQEMNMQGMGIEILARVKRPGQIYESQTRTFLSDDLEHEIWSIATYLRSITADGKPAPKTTTAWVETGIRSGKKMDVKREGPTGIRRRNWVPPEEGYLSQVMLHLVEPLLPHRQREKMAFYAYHADTGRIALRTLEVLPGRDGSYRVRSRPNLDHPEAVSHYDAQGKFLKRELYGGLLVEPTTVGRLRLIWKNERF